MPNQLLKYIWMIPPRFLLSSVLLPLAWYYLYRLYIHTTFSLSPFLSRDPTLSPCPPLSPSRLPSDLFSPPSTPVLSRVDQLPLVLPHFSASTLNLYLTGP